MKQTLGWEPLIQSFNTNMKNLITRSNYAKTNLTDLKQSINIKIK